MHLSEPGVPTEIEIWASNSEGAYKVSEIGSIPVPKTLAEAMASKHWPLFKAAMETDITGKLANKAWVVVRRPDRDRVHPVEHARGRCTMELSPEALKTEQ